MKLGVKTMSVQETQSLCFQFAIINNTNMTVVEKRHEIKLVLFEEIVFGNRFLKNM